MTKQSSSLKTNRSSSGARDVETGEILFVLASDRRSSFHAYVFLKEVPRYCENKPEVVVDRRFWYLWALNSLGLKYERETCFPSLRRG